MRHWRFAKFKNLRFVFVRHRRSFELTFSSSCMGGLAEPVNEIAANSAFSLSADSFSTPSKNGGHFNLMPYSVPKMGNCSCPSLPVYFCLHGHKHKKDLHTNKGKYNF